VPKYYDAQSMMDAAEKDTSSSLKIQQDRKMQSPLKGMKKDGTMPAGPSAGQIPHTSYAPRDLSPSGDLGIKDDKEQHGMFHHPIKGADAEWRSSKHLPMGKPRIKCSDTDVIGTVKGPETMGGVIGGEFDLKDYSGVRAGSKPGRNQRGVKANMGAREGGYEGWRSV
jgi:hypothetical protein